MIQKASREVLKRMELRASEQADQIETLRTIATQYDASFWNMVSQRLESYKKKLAYLRRQNYAKFTQEEFRISYAKEEALDQVIALPNDCKKSLDALQEEHIKMKGKIREYRKRLSEEE